MMRAAAATLSLADRPVMFPCSRAPRSSSSTSATAASISTAPSAPAAMRARSLRADARVIGIDRDQSAIAHGAGLVLQVGRPPHAGRRPLLRARCGGARSSAIDAVDGVVLDVGVSSMQLDEAERGFSFRLDGPLDMRMGGEGPSAADVIAHASERDLADIIATLGEERFARRWPRAIVAARAKAPITTTGALAGIVGARGARAARPHPSGDADVPGAAHFRQRGTGELAAGLAAAERILKPGGRLVVVTFHSLEDRIVKTFMTERSRHARRFASCAGNRGAVADLQAC